MRYLSVAIHYPKPEHVDDLLGAMKRLGEALQTVPGLLDASAWKDSVSGRIVAISTWESRQAFLNARPVIGETIKDVPFDEWEAKPRELFNLDEIEERAIGRMKVYMRAIVYHTYGSPNVLELKEIEKPTPKDDEVLIKVQAASVNALDWHLLSADIFLVRLNSGLTKPKLQILGADIAGQVEAVGKDVKQLSPDDEVFGDIFDSGLGGFAEYVCTKEDALVLKPDNLAFEEAAAIPVAALTALQGLRKKGQIQSGQKVLINGASGGVGTFAVQIAKAFGAEVTAVTSTGNVDMARSLGADQVIDYTKVDFTKSGQQYDLILAVNGYHPILDYKRALRPKGRYVMSGGTMAQFGQAVLLGPVISMTSSQKMGNFMAKANHHDLLVLKELVEAGKIKPVIDRRYPLSEAAEAMRYHGAGHAQGKVIITVAQNNDIPLKTT